MDVFSGDSYNGIRKLNVIDWLAGGKNSILPT